MTRDLVSPDDRSVGPSACFVEATRSSVTVADGSDRPAHASVRGMQQIVGPRERIVAARPFSVVPHACFDSFHHWIVEPLEESVTDAACSVVRTL